MKDIESLLRSAVQVQTHRELSTNFTARIVSELRKHPRPQSSWAQRVKEALGMRKMSTGMAIFLAVIAVGLAGGITYAAINYPSLKSLLTAPAVQKPDGSTIQPSDMQKIYKKYINETAQGDASARSNFERYVTRELANKLATVKGIDPIICAQNVPQSVNFINNNITGSMTVVNHFGSGDVKVQLSYDSGSGIFTDITCPVSDDASVAKKMQGYYEQYVADVRNEVAPGDTMNSFLPHTDAALAAKLRATQGYDPIVCAQNTPAMVTFKDVTRTSMTAVVAFLDSSNDVKLTFDPSTAKFTSITCPTP